MLLAMTGPKRHGKDTVADAIVAEFEYEKIAFAGTLKGMIRFLLESSGMTDPEEIAYYMEGDGKELPLTRLQGKSCRHAMQTLGTEWRDHLGKNLWTDIVKAKVEVTARPIITDLRFLHEAQYVDDQGGFIIRVVRAGRPKISPDPHPSETEMASIDVDATIYNHGSLEDLQKVARMTAMFAITNSLTLQEIAQAWDIAS